MLTAAISDQKIEQRRAEDRAGKQRDLTGEARHG
jgi:hypothetical protein